jgi:chromosomal replication initiator protein
MSGITTPLIIAMSCRYFGVSREELLRQDRQRRVARRRQVAMFVGHTIYGQSLARLGRAFGGRDHTTVLHAVRKIREEIDRGDLALAQDVDGLVATIKDVLAPAWKACR